MAKKCDICNKGANTANSVTRRGRAKRKGGAGRKITGRSKRTQKPNLQTVKTIIDGQKKKIRVCTSCLKAGKIIPVR